MKTLITNIVIAVLGALAAAGVKVPNVDAGTVTEVVGAIATLAAVINQLVHYFRDKPQDPLKDYQVPRALRPKVRDRGFALPSMLMLLLACLVLVLLAGCAGITPNGNMSPEQLAAAAKDKSASVACGTGTGPWGKVNTVYVNVDKASVTNGTVTVDAECKVSVSTAQKPPQ